MSAACDVRLRASVDPGSTPGTWRERETMTPGDEEPAVDGALWWEHARGAGDLWHRVRDRLQ